MDDISLLDVVVKDDLVLKHELPVVHQPLKIWLDADYPVDLDFDALHAVPLFHLQLEVCSSHSLYGDLHLVFSWRGTYVKVLGEA